MGDLKIQGITPAVGKIKVGDINVQKIYNGDEFVWPISIDPGQVEICNLTWTDTNSSETELIAGGNLPILTNQTDWYNAWQAQTPAACYWDFDSNNASYGLIYNLFARNVVKPPIGFRLPTNADWDVLASQPCFPSPAPTGNQNRYGANPGDWDPLLLTVTDELGDSGFNSQGYGRAFLNVITGAFSFNFPGQSIAYHTDDTTNYSKGYGWYVTNNSLASFFMPLNGNPDNGAEALFIRFVKDA